MLRFVDLNTGNVFDGSNPYIFWFDGEQSTNLIYTKSICFISNKRRISVELNSPIFSLIDDSKINSTQVESIYGFDYKDINLLKTKSLTKQGLRYNDYYIYVIYIMGSAEQDGEYIENLIIDKETYRIGADFYLENESLYINLSNHGVEIPNNIQKSIYSTNVHEDKTDHITLNRKWKELLSNLWEVVANKGSYLSLYNSLKWFEWGDLLRICEVWKRRDGDKDVYSVRDIQEVLGDKYFETLSGFAKTTYVAICCALQKIQSDEGKTIYDQEKNPKLEAIVSKWSIEDLSLKLSLLGSFYKTYFMPIHLDLIHATIEDVVFTNTFKSMTSSLFQRDDFIYNTKDIICNVKDNTTYKLGNVQAYVNSKTLFGEQYNNHENYSDFDIIGVQKENIVINPKDDNELKTYYGQLYNAEGAIVEFDLEVPLTSMDEIVREVLVFRRGNDWKTIEDHKVLGKDVKFCLLCKTIGDYEVRLQFNTSLGKTYTKRVNFNVIDTSHTSVKIYKVENIRIPQESALSLINDWIFGPSNISKELFTQYLPTKLVNPNSYDHWGYKGICLNHLLVLKSDVNQYVEANYFVSDLQKDINYKICISKEFGFKPQQIFLRGLDIFKNEYIFVPKFHKLSELGSDRGDRKEDIRYYTITDETLCVVPEIAYGKYVKYIEWEFVNASNGEVIKLINPSNEPFIAPSEDKPLSPGYYNIKFKYSLNGDDVNEYQINSAFRKL